MDPATTATVPQISHWHDIREASPEMPGVSEYLNLCAKGDELGGGRSRQVYLPAGAVFSMSGCSCRCRCQVPAQQRSPSLQAKRHSQDISCRQ